jgi:AAA family ATP:ADP antiporter
MMPELRRGELSRTLLSFGMLWLIVGSYTLVKTVRDAVFLSRFGITEMSVVAIVLAALAGVIVTIYQRVTKKLSRPWLIGSTHVLIAGSLIVLSVLLQSNPDAAWLAWTLYIWSSLFGVFIVMQFWLLASDLFDVREAKRLFGIIGAGAIMGGLTGGLMAQQLAARMSAATLLMIASGMLLLAALFGHLVWPQRQVEMPTTKKSDAQQSSLLELFAKPSFVRLIASALLLSTMATTLLDWQFKAIAKRAFEGRTEAMVSFFGSLFAYQSAASLAFQIIATSWLLRRLGVGVARNFLPVALLVGAGAIVMSPALPITLLTAAAGAKVAEGGLRFAIDKATVELTWLPLPKELRSRSKSYIDTVVDRLGTGLTGVLWLMLAMFGFDDPARIHLISLLSVGLIAGWLVVLYKMQIAYVDAFRESLAKRTIDLDSMRMALGEAEAKRTIDGALDDTDVDRVRFGLYLLVDSDTELPDLSGPLGHADSGVRAQTLRLATQHSEAQYRTQADALLADADASVRQAAIMYLRHVGHGDGIHDDLDEEDDAMPLSHAIVRLSSPATRDTSFSRIRAAIAADHPNRLGHISELGAAPADMATELLEPLLDDDDPAVVLAALHAAGRAGAVNLADKLGDMLHDRQWRQKALNALAELGAPAIAALLPRVHDDDTPLEVKRAIVRLAGGSRSAEMAAPLDALLDSDPTIARLALHALARLGASLPVQANQGRLRQLLLNEAHKLRRDLLFLDRGAWPLAREPAEGEDLFGRAVREKTDLRVRRVFSMLSLLHAPGDVRGAFRGIRSPMRRTRANSVELLDNLLPADLRDALLPSLDETNAGQFRLQARRSSGLERETVTQALRRMLSGLDPWMRAVACWKIGESRVTALRHTIEALAAEPGMLGTVAQRSLHHIDDDTHEEPKVGLTVVEKALRLRSVDVLRQTTSEDLAYVAQIAEEIELEAEAAIYADGDVPDALYVVIAGEVELRQADVEIGVIGPGEDFGSWALVDDAPRVASATTRAPTTVLRVAREDFIDLLADRTDIVQAVFKAMVGRIRSLADLALDDD